MNAGVGATSQGAGRSPIGHVRRWNRTGATGRTFPTRPGRSVPRAWRTRRGFSYLETMVAAFILGLVVVAALQATGYVAQAQLVIEQRIRAGMLADELMAEIATKRYEDPTSPGGFGPETDEQTGDRSAFDDVDDYDGWSAEPPVAADGTVLSEFSGFRRQVKVEQVDDADPTLLVPLGASGTKRVTVTVTRGDRIQVSRQCLFTLNAMEADAP